MYLLDFDVENPSSRTNRKRSSILTPLAPGRSTHFFSDPSGLFETKTFSSELSNVWRTFKNKKYDPQQKHVIFPEVNEEYPLPPEEEEENEVLGSHLSNEGAFSSSSDQLQWGADSFETEEAREESKQNEISAELKNIFIQHIKKSLVCCPTKGFSDLLVLGESYESIYSDLSESLDFNQAEKNWGGFLANLKFLAMLLQKEASANYVWLEDEKGYTLIANCPEKNILPFLISHEKYDLAEVFPKGEHFPIPESQWQQFFLLEGGPDPTLTEEELDEEMESDDGIATPEDIAESYPEALDESYEKPSITNQALREAATVTPTGMVLDQPHAKYILAQIVPQLPAETDSIVVQDKESEVVISEQSGMDSEALHETCHNLFSLAGLCSSILEQDFDVSFLCIETELDYLIFAQDLENDLYLTTTVKVLNW